VIGVSITRLSPYFFHNPLDTCTQKLNYSKKVKEHCVQEAQFLSSNHHVVLPWCAQALAFIELPVDNVKSRFQCFICSASFCQKLVAKNAKVAENGHIVTSWTFFNALSHIPKLYLKHTKLLQSRPEAVLCTCAVSAFWFALFWQ
jgi:hypothetical protein